MEFWRRGDLQSERGKQMSFSFRGLFFVSIAFVLTIVILVAGGASLLAERYSEENRKNFIEMTMASLEAGPLALARLHAADYAQKHLDRIVQQLNTETELIHKVQIYSKGAETFGFANHKPTFELDTRCARSITKEFSFPDAISSFYITMEIDSCKTLSGVDSVLKTVFLTLFGIAFIVLMGFLILSYPVLLSIRMGSSVIGSEDVVSDNILKSIPFKPVRGMTSLALRAKQLEREAAKTEIAKQVAHDIKSPLTALKAAIEMFDLDTKKSKKLAESALSRVVGIVEDLNGDRSAKLKDSRDVKIVIEEAIKLKQIEYPEINIQLKIDDKWPLIYLDAVIMSRCLSNLINNSIEAGAKNIEVELINQNGICVMVQDDGRGMSRENIEKAGQKGFTAHKLSGKGLGLSYVKEQIELLKGRLDIVSELNVGTKIIINLQNHT